MQPSARLALRSFIGVHLRLDILAVLPILLSTNLICVMAQFIEHDEEDLGLYSPMMMFAKLSILLLYFRLFVVSQKPPWICVGIVTTLLDHVIATILYTTFCGERGFKLLGKFPSSLSSWLFGLRRLRSKQSSVKSENKEDRLTTPSEENGIHGTPR